MLNMADLVTLNVNITMKTLTRFLFDFYDYLPLWLTLMKIKLTSTKLTPINIRRCVCITFNKVL